jgi:amidase
LFSAFFLSIPSHTSSLPGAYNIVVPMAPAAVTIESGATWEEVAADRQKYRDASIAAVQPLVPDPPADLPLNVATIPRDLLHGDEVEITEAPPEEILFRLANREISAKQVVIAFLRRAGLAQKLVLLASAHWISIPN